MDKKVSIIIPCFNQGKYVADAIESALNQTYENIEIVCINDGSSDNSSEIIKNLVDKYKKILFLDLKKNEGVINARNLAIDASSGEYILPLDADDTIEPTYIAKATEILNNKPEVGIVYCKARKFGNENGIWDLPDFNKDDFLYDNCIFNCALFRKRDFLNAGKYKENMINGYENWDLWLSILEIGFKPYRIDEILFNYRIQDNFRTTSSKKNTSWKIMFIKNHIESYLKDSSFAKRVFVNPDDRLRKKVKKYKNLFKLFLTLFVLILGILLWIMILN